MKYEFNHDAQRVAESIGLSEDRISWINDVAIDVATRAVLTDERMNTISQEFEAALNEAYPKNIVEAIFLGYALGTTKQKMHHGEIIQALKHMAQ